MRRWAVVLWMSGIVALACGSSESAPATGSSGDGESTASATSMAVTTGGAEPLDYGRCSEPPLGSSDAFESPDTARLMQLLDQSIIDAGYGEAARVEHAEMISSNNVLFCPKLSVRSHWFAATDRTCFSYGSDDEMRAQFKTYLAEWPPLPATMISLDEVEAIANSCFPEIYYPYEPCNTPWSSKFQLQFRTGSWINDCVYEMDVATVDLATGALVECFTNLGGGCEEG